MEKTMTSFVFQDFSYSNGDYIIFGFKDTSFQSGTSANSPNVLSFSWLF